MPINQINWSSPSVKSLVRGDALHKWREAAGMAGSLTFSTPGIPFLTV
ncbi:hypothetical protein MMF93_15065 [Streptomyces tubbatahanensis]|uniref:Uncharacterized protein n=1 Tax=Streptomyces tubbatahanensis TaxID=2923272 RepID=A0ABY3XT46_9ACTN|nr:hypothetical protein [Streptomyces tubbatahanensis]UNS97661.1 hypothetical protein MMF93_15065 [Streptomyces tubbatahanensis]